MFTGCGTALVTPFRQDQSLDEAALRALVRRQISGGIDFLVPCGMWNSSKGSTPRGSGEYQASSPFGCAIGKTPCL